MSTTTLLSEQSHLEPIVQHVQIIGPDRNLSLLEKKIYRVLNSRLPNGWSKLQNFLTSTPELYEVIKGNNNLKIPLIIELLEEFSSDSIVSIPFEMTQSIIDAYTAASDIESRNQELETLVNKLSNNKSFEAAIRCARDISNKEIKIEAFKNILKDLIAYEKIDKTIAPASLSGNETFKYICQYLAKDKKFNLSIEIARIITDRKIRKKASEEILESSIKNESIALIGETLASILPEAAEVIKEKALCLSIEGEKDLAIKVANCILGETTRMTVLNEISKS